MRTCNCQTTTARHHRRRSPPAARDRGCKDNTMGYTPSTDETNPALGFRGLETDLLVHYLRNKQHAELYLSLEVANRGLDESGKWVGFEKAAELHQRRMYEAMLPHKVYKVPNHISAAVASLEGGYDPRHVYAALCRKHKREDLEITKADQLGPAIEQAIAHVNLIGNEFAEQAAFSMGIVR